MESDLGTALIAFVATLAGAIVSLIGVIWQQKQNEKAAETNRRTALREASLERIAEELFAIVRDQESIPHQHTPAHEHLAWEKTLREHLLRIQLTALRLDPPELRARIRDMCSLLSDWDRLQPHAWPHEVVTGATQHAIDSIEAFLLNPTGPLSPPGPVIQKLHQARERANEDERNAAEETRANLST
ncbi:hypothetical protein [Streptomyces sp. NPDC007929]|uniref:hypothetical protein n=1 Tax=unclassified Streptomyces TaxID=2593676 RepID=UPI0036F0DEBA